MPKNFYEIEKKLEQVVGSVNTVQLDLMDGKYVTSKTWPFNDMVGDSWQSLLTEEYGMPEWESVNYELDLMVEDVPNYFQDLMRIGPSRIIFHFPKNEIKKKELKDFIKNLDNFYKYEIELGVAYEHSDSIEDVMDIKDDIKFVQCMGIEHVGVQGALYDSTVISRIQEVKDKMPDMVISVDGSVNKNTIKELFDAGVTRFVAGSALFNAEYPSMAINELYEILEN